MRLSLGLRADESFVKGKPSHVLCRVSQRGRWPDRRSFQSAGNRAACSQPCGYLQCVRCRRAVRAKWRAIVRIATG